MKQHLRFLLLATLTSTQIVSVVACGTNSLESITPEDVLNRAEGQMQSTTFKMNSDLKLEDLPTNGASYTTLSDVARTVISEFYSAKVSNDGSSSWENETVAVTISDNSATFINKYGDFVEARITLTANLSFKGLSSSVPIVVKITNDLASSKQKMDEIGTVLTTYLNTAPTIEFKSLFVDGLKANVASYIYPQITSGLEDAIFTNSENEDIGPVIDVEGIDFKVIPAPPTDESIIYELDNADADNSLFNGHLQNLTLQIFDGTNPYTVKTSDLTGDAQKIKVTQKFPDAQNQISAILKQGSDAIWFKDTQLVNGEMPTFGDTFESYAIDDNDPNKKVFIDTIQTTLFNLITLIYPTAKIDASSSNWISESIDFPNAGSHQFVYEIGEPDPSNPPPFSKGYFLVNVSFDANIGDKTIHALVGNLKINLSKNNT